MLWKIYFWALALLSGTGLADLLYSGPHEVYPFADYILLPVTAVQVAGLFGYAFRKPLLSAVVWRGLFPVFVIAFAAALLVGGYRFSLVQDVGVPAATIFVAIFALPLFFPLLLANRWYAFGCQDIWSSERMAARPLGDQRCCEGFGRVGTATTSTGGAAWTGSRTLTFSNGGP